MGFESSVFWLAVALDLGAVGATYLFCRQAKKPRVQAILFCSVPSEGVKISWLLTIKRSQIMLTSDSYERSGQSLTEPRVRSSTCRGQFIGPWAKIGLAHRSKSWKIGNQNWKTISGWPVVPFLREQIIGYLTWKIGNMKTPTWKIGNPLTPTWNFW